MKARIVVIEDDENDVLFYGRAFSKAAMEFDVEYFTSAKNAAQNLESRPTEELPQVILMDTNTPEMRAVEFLNWIQEQPSLSHIPVIAVSGGKSSKEIEALYNAGLKQFLQKP